MTVSTRAKRKGRKVVEKKNKTLGRLEVTYVPMDQVYPNEYNPNRQSEHDFALLCSSMEEDGFTTPIVVNKSGEIVDGEHRWRAATALGFGEIPVVYVDMSKEQMRISTIRHNRARGSHDLELEAQVLRDLQQLGALEWAQDSLLMDDAELSRLLDDIAAPEAFSDADFTEAWVPDTFTSKEVTLIQEGAMTTEAYIQSHGDSGETISAMTAKAIEQQRKRERLIKKAKTEEERQMALKEQEIYRVNLLFGGDEAEVVKEALGLHPAETLLRMCEEALDGHNQIEEIL